MWMEFHFNNTTKLMEQKAQQILADRDKVEQYASQLSSIVNEVDKREREIDEQRVINVIEKEESERRAREMKDLINHNKAVLRENEKVLKKNSTQLYHLKEASSHLHTHYNQIVKLSEDLMLGKGIEPKYLESVRQEAMHNIMLIDDYFFNSFRMTVDQHKKSLTNVVARPKRKGGDTLGLITESSLN